MWPRQTGFGKLGEIFVTKMGNQYEEIVLLDESLEEILISSVRPKQEFPPKPKPNRNRNIFAETEPKPNRNITYFS